MTYSVGSGGGLRVQAPLKVMVTDMGMFTVPASVKVDFVNKKFDEQGTFVFLFCVINYTKFNCILIVQKIKFRGNWNSKIRC